jgi:hypothetical protein
MWLILDSVDNRVGRASAYGSPISWADAGQPRPLWVEQAGQDGFGAVAAVTIIQGTGGFSDTRSVALLGNTLSWLKPETKMYVVSLAEGQRAPETAEELMRLGQATNQIKPAYSAEPNITKAKKS